MPVFNRLAMTQIMVECLRQQIVSEPINIIIIDDCSTDQTPDYLSRQDDITVLNGDGDLWWGGCVDVALNHIFDASKKEDWVLLINNDTQIKPDFLQCLLNTAQSHYPSAVGSIIRDEESPYKIISIGTKINAWMMTITDKLSLIKNSHSSSIVKVDALSGRGALFPLFALRKTKGMRPKLLPHYLADYELSLRVKKTGCNLLVDVNAAVYSKDEYGNAVQASSLIEKLLSINSPSYLPAVLCFWWEASNIMQRITFPFRFLFFIMFPVFRRESK